MFNNKTHNGIEYKESSNDKGWKIVHNESNIILLNCDNYITGTIHDVYFTPNFRSMMQYIKINKLNVGSIELYNYEKYYNEIVGDAVLPSDNDLIEFLNRFTFND